MQRFNERAIITLMVAAFWRHGSLAALAATLLLARQAAADPVLRTAAKLSQPRPPPTEGQPSLPGNAQPSLPGNAQPSLLAAGQVSFPADGQLAPPVNPQLSLPANAQLSSAWNTGAPVNAQLGPPVNAQLNLPANAQLNLPANPPVSLQNGSVLERVPTASWAMGCAAGIALAMHAIYQNSSDRHRMRMKSCGDECSNYRIDHYEETRERADVALRLSVFAAASALWLVYNDPQEALERMGQRKPPREQPGFRVKVKTERRGVWASVVAYF